MILFEGYHEGPIYCKGSCFSPVRKCVLFKREIRLGPMHLDLGPLKETILKRNLSIGT